MFQSEAQTRSELVDQQLAQSGWNVNDPTQVVEEFGILIALPEGVVEPRLAYERYEFSDYVLLGKDHRPLAVIEAKKTSRDATIGREQAKQYCYNIQKQLGGELPFCFYTNGHDIYFWDLDNAPPRKVIGFPTRDDLERFSYLRRNRKPLTQEFINTSIAGRDYQIRAIRSVLEGIEQKKRDFLLVMATGTGKTRTCIAMADALMRAGHAERVLFLVDRIALREQALAAFKEHMPNEPRWPNMGEKLIAKDRRVYVATYPTMLNIIRDEVQQLSPHFFDFIVVDESHRSIYNTFSEVLDYFKTITLGLTATPTDIIDHNTFQLFHCEDGLPTFAYTFEEAVNHVPPYLSNFQVMKIQTKFQMEGISKRTISLEDQKKLILQGKEVEEINFEGSQLEKQVINKGTNTLIVREFMEEAIKDANGVLPGKTIFFCATKAHARRMEEIFDKLYPQYNGELAKVLVSDDPRVYGKGGLLDQFTNNDMPRVAISVDMLDTGIDVREIVNLVFAKPVYSYTKFWQMVGRGTRLLETSKPKPWCLEKDMFLILDCWDNFEYFKLNPKGKEPKPQLSLPVRLVGLRIDKIEKANDIGHVDIAIREVAKLRMQIASLPTESVVIREASAILARLANENFWITLSHDQLEFLRTEIKPLFRTVSETDFKAMRFERDLLEYSLAVLNEDKRQAETLKSGIVEQISELPLSVSFVKQYETLIRAAQTNHYWALATEDAFDDVVASLGPLMKFREQSSAQQQTILDLADELHKKEWVEFGPQHEAVSITRYREMVEALITELTEHNPVLQKIRSGGVISTIEANELSELLHEEHPHITEDLLRRVYKNRKAHLIQFIRHILGLEVLRNFPDTVSEAFTRFIRVHTTLSSRQMEFLALLKEFIIEREKVEKKDLINTPFTVIHPQGIRGVFSPAEINEILQLTERLSA
ncbi:DEAD/DEAH box helicase family protein [Pseudomonas fluorescens]|uniref:type I restriction endonuclease subunit R n=1 Tax=Pseudomonas fluorescens TaxID=294 RepID=UPI0017838C4F|nr:DEAD/DEAH box helicase family protein [Pseudomonas fluorescens]MBD8191492.1 DEAD/DEAH box helicase family protein [Pseudomonas fluorescens]MBD8225523.1 DEAD/DEAH box helicase family protein [Pseudomonas fluorescens]MBD8783241.1 DEAD/DEAH box helicase family protein [Pseudomonas fluorescens]MBD8816663.1 DEAD/DEAH box helicase family protein [Pseudomonas fluorescens]